MYNVSEDFFIIGDKNNIEKYNINGFYTHTGKNDEGVEETKTYYVYQKGEVTMTIGENFMFKTLEEVKAKIFEKLDENLVEIEKIRKDILEFNV